MTKEGKMLHINCSITTRRLCNHIRLHSSFFRSICMALQFGFDSMRRRSAFKHQPTRAQAAKGKTLVSQDSIGCHIITSATCQRQLKELCSRQTIEGFRMFAFANSYMYFYMYSEKFVSLDFYAKRFSLFTGLPLINPSS